MNPETVENIYRVHQAANDLRTSHLDYCRKNSKRFLVHTKPLFDKYPRLKKLSWVQFTPYFNDGDERLFVTRFDDLMLNDVPSDSRPFYDNEWFHYEDVGNEGFRVWERVKSDTNYNDGLLVRKFGGDWQKWLHLAVDDITAALESVNENFQVLFGDHVKVTVFGDRILIDDHIHHD